MSLYVGISMVITTLTWTILYTFSLLEDMNSATKELTCFWSLWQD